MQFKYESSKGYYRLVGADTLIPFKADPTYLLKLGSLTSGVTSSPFSNNPENLVNNSTANKISGYTSTSNGYLGTIYSKSIDLSKYDTIEVVACSLSGVPLYLALCTSNSAYSSIYSIRQGVTYIDVSSLTGTIQIGIIGYVVWNGTSSVSASIDEVRLT